MAFNLATFKTRTGTAIIFVAVMLAGLLWNQWSFFILFSVIHFGCWFEFQKLVALIDPGYKEITPFHKYGIMLAGWSLMLWFTGNDYRLFGMYLHELGWWIGLTIVFILPITELLFTKTIRLKNIGHSLFGLVYVSLSIGLLMNLRMAFASFSCLNDAGILADVNYTFSFSLILIPLIIIASIWINDTMAYIVGSFIGKTPLSKISPKKTWEGTIGGILLAIASVGFLLNSFPEASMLFQWLNKPASYHWFIIVAIAAIAGTFGDLLESKLKRMAGVKDSGAIMPGHGGFLDRFDSLLVAVPLVWLYVRLAMS